MQGLEQLIEAASHRREQNKNYTSRDWAILEIPKAEEKFARALYTLGPRHPLTKERYSRINLLLDWLLPFSWEGKMEGNA